MLVAVMTMLTRIALPSRPTMILLALAFVPAATAIHIAPRRGSESRPRVRPSD